MEWKGKVVSTRSLAHAPSLVLQEQCFRHDVCGNVDEDSRCDPVVDIASDLQQTRKGPMAVVEGDGWEADSEDWKEKEARGSLFSGDPGAGEPFDGLVAAHVGEGWTKRCWWCQCRRYRRKQDAVQKFRQNSSRRPEAMHDGVCDGACFYPAPNSCNVRVATKFSWYGTRSQCCLMSNHIPLVHLWERDSKHSFEAIRIQRAATIEQHLRLLLWRQRSTLDRDHHVLILGLHIQPCPFEVNDPGVHALPSRRFCRVPRRRKLSCVLCPVSCVLSCVSAPLLLPAAGTKKNSA